MTATTCATFNGIPAGAQTATLLHTFNTTADGAAPHMRMVQAPDGTLYGTTNLGGVYNEGTVFKITPDNHFQTIYSFNPKARNGGEPYGTLALGPDGAIYGATYRGGTGNAGVVFRITADGSESVLHSFSSATGYFPIGGLAYDSADGNFYGMASQGGASNNGVVFRISPAGSYSVVKDLDAGTGDYPTGGFFYNTADNLLYGKTTGGGTGGRGTIFSISSAGALTVIKNLDDTTGFDFNDTVAADIMRAADGNLYGTLNVGGTGAGRGTIFKIAGGVFSVIYNFTNTGGSHPESGLVQAADGAFYGTTTFGEMFGGNVFRLTLGATPTVTSIHNFSSADEYDPGPLTLAANGLLYGAASGSVVGLGSVFNITTTGSFFTIQALSRGFHDGIQPTSGLLAATDGNFYGTTLSKNTENIETIYQMTPQGVVHILFDFDLNGPIGWASRGNLIEGAAGTFYGVTAFASTSNGTVFKFTVSGNPAVATVTPLYTFGPADGRPAGGGLLLGKDGNLYGTTTLAGTSNHGTLYRVTPAGAHTDLLSFTAASGYDISTALVQGSDGDLYGIAPHGGANNSGSIFRVTTAGHVVWNTPLTADMTSLSSGLAFGADGSLYGVTSTGGVNGAGSIFRITTSGVLSTVYSFDTTHGYDPIGTLALAADGGLYGIAKDGGVSRDAGTLFRYTPDGVTFVFNFTTAIAQYENHTVPSGAIVNYLTVMPDGSLYGTSPYGGISGSGTAYRYGLVAPAITSIAPASGMVGTIVKITGTNFTGATAVAFNGVPATTFTVSSATSIKATVPADATSGPISVTAPGGVGISGASFTLTPTIASFTPASGPIGTKVTITGTGFTGAKSVTFNGAASAFTFTSSTAIIATVPPGATTGKISVTTPGGSANSVATFTLTIPAPTITSFTPASGQAGTVVRITGTNFTGATTVKFNGVVATPFTVVNSTLITAAVPNGASTGKISVITPGGTVVSADSFTVLPSKPAITKFTPVSGPVGTSVTITGTNFTGATAVKFNGTAATVRTVNSATSITATVPAGATTGKISVITPGGTGVSTDSFTVTPSKPTIISFTPASGKVGTLVTITGTNFTGATAVKFNGVATTAFTVVSPTKITVTVPTHATTGPISILTPNGTAVSTATFTVTSG